MKPIRIQLSRRKGWRIPENTLIVSRPSMFGNPFRAIDKRNKASVEKSIEYYKKYLDGFGAFECGPSTGVAMAFFPDWSDLSEIRKNLPRLAGKNLACWCKIGTPCHADILLALANPDPEPGRALGEE